MSDIINNDSHYQAMGTKISTTDALSHMSVENALEYLEFDKLHYTDSQIQGQMKDLQANNARVKNLSSVLNALRNAMPKADSSGKVKIEDVIQSFYDTDSKLYNPNSIPNVQGVVQGYVYWLSEVGIPTATINSTSNPKIDLNQTIEQAKTVIDNANSTNQMQMVRLQSLSNTRNEIFNMVSNSMKKMDDIALNTIHNLT